MSENKEENSVPAADVKEEEKSQKSEESKTPDESSKDSEKDSVKEEKSVKKEEKEKGSEKDDTDDDDDDDDEEVGLLDRPVEVYGCRARKQVERLEISFTAKEKQDIPEGKGDKLGDCPRIEFQIQKTLTNELKPLHRILFNRLGSGPEIKKNIRKFSGFTFAKDSTEYERKKGSLDKLNIPVLKQICENLDLDKKGTKEDIVNRVLDFLMQPKDSGKKVPKAKQSKDKKKAGEKKVNKKGKTKKEVPSDDDTNSADGSGASEDADGDDEEEDNDKDDVDSDDTAKKTKATKSKKTPLKTMAKKIVEKKEKAKKEEKKTSKVVKRKRDDSSDESDKNEDEEKPSPKKAKMPTDDEIKKLVKSILEAADLQEITMKKVIKQVSDAYPDSDLSHKKAFIKSTIKSVIS